MQKIIFFIALGLFIWACSNSGADGASAENSVTSVGKAATSGQAKVDGEAIYKKRCVVCHGINGDMGMSGAKDLTQSELPVEERVQIITNGKNVMTAFGGILEEEEIKAVAEYTFSLKK